MTSKTSLFLPGLLALSIVATAAPYPEEKIPSFGGCYFARAGLVPLWRMRDQDGCIREFEPHAKHKGLLVGCGGWTATDGGKGAVTVRTPPKIEPRIVYHFTNGRLAEAEIDGKRCRFSYPEPLVYDDPKIVPLWPESGANADEDFVKRMSAQWKFGKRKSYGFASPNQAGVVFSVLLLVFLAWALKVKSRLLRALCSAVAVAALALLLTTASRGAMVATAAGLVPLLLIRYRTCLSSTFIRAHGRAVTIALVAAVMCVVAACAVSSRFRPDGGGRKADAFRVELMRTAPRMFYDAPNGWGTRRDVGRAYTAWYQTLTKGRQMFGLVSDHMTEMAALGWWKGAVYVFLWAAGLAALWLVAVRGGTAVPAVAWTALGVASAFNVVLFVKYVSWPALATLPLLIFEHEFRRARFWILPCAIGLAGAVLVAGGLLLVGSQTDVKSPPVRCTGEGVIVNGRQTATWLVGDRDVLGLTTVRQEIRNFYEQLPTAPALGFSESLEAVPLSGVQRLVLAGARGTEYLDRFRKGKVRSFPREIVFLAPPFGSSAIPVELHRRAQVRIVIGEFAARYHEDYAYAQKWVTLVEGAEVYISGWMRFCAGRF